MPFRQNAYPRTLILFYHTLVAETTKKSLDTALCMGARIGQAHGIEKAMSEDAQGKVAAVIGDSTFLHSGITSLLNTSYNKGRETVIIGSAFDSISHPKTRNYLTYCGNPIDLSFHKVSLSFP